MAAGRDEIILDIVHEICSGNSVVRKGRIFPDSRTQTACVYPHQSNVTNTSVFDVVVIVVIVVVFVVVTFAFVVVVGVGSVHTANTIGTVVNVGLRI